MKNQLFIFLCAALLACGGSGDKPKPTTTMESDPGTAMSKNDDGLGIGEIKEVKLNDPLDVDMVKRGQAISDMKCAACHRYTDMRVVGPGWKGVTERRKPEWIMNMITNVEVMLEQDETARKLLEECLTRMPNQNLSIGDARDVLEFMYAIDTDQAPK
ncbi:MAG: cytochrome c [Saprospiraceae bacterium]|nr:cytochrome c [Saprospiraceae bacterium]